MGSADPLLHGQVQTAQPGDSVLVHTVCDSTLCLCRRPSVLQATSSQLTNVTERFIDAHRVLLQVLHVAPTTGSLDPSIVILGPKLPTSILYKSALTSAVDRRARTPHHSVTMGTSLIAFA